MTGSNHQAGGTIPSSDRVRRAAVDPVAQVQARLLQRFYSGATLGEIDFAALITRMADSTEAIVAVMHASLSTDGLILWRSFFEHAVVLSGPAIDLPTKISQRIDDANAWDLELHTDALRYGVTFLSEDEITAMDSPRRRPSPARVAADADQHRGPRIVGFAAPAEGPQKKSHRSAAFDVALYRIASRAVHGQPQVLDANGDLRAHPTCIDRPSTSGKSYWPLVVPLCAQTLPVCHRVLGWPDPDAVRSPTTRCMRRPRQAAKTPDDPRRRPRHIDAEKLRLWMTAPNRLRGTVRQGAF